MPKVHHVKCARKDHPRYGVEKGDSYYWWKFRTGRTSRKVVSKTRPRRSQLTQSDFLSSLYDLEDGIADRFANDMDPDDACSELESLADDIRQLGAEAEESRENMPEALQDGPTGELLQERAESMESWADDVVSLDPKDHEGADALVEAINECQPDIS